MGAPLRQLVSPFRAPNLPLPSGPQSRIARLQEGSAATLRGQAKQEDPAELALDLPIGPGALRLPSAPNLSVEDRSEAERRFAVIEPLVHPAGFKALWVEHGTRGALVAHICKVNQIGQSTLYGWLQRWKNLGLEGLAPKSRSDKGVPRALNAATYDYLWEASVPRPGQFGEWSIREIFRSYLEEKSWRAAHVGKKLSGGEADRYARYLDAEDRLSEGALLSEASYETIRRCYIHIPEALRVLARKGIEAFSNTQEIISFRNLAAVKPLDYVVMDHRRLDLFALVPERGGWKLARPWLTAAIDMRTRKWLAWAIVESPSSDSIATVLKRVFLDFGLPSRCYFDNGRDFTCEWFEGKRAQTRQAPRIGEMPAAWRGVLETLGVRITHAIVRRARSKIIEPNFVRTSNFDRSTPWWVGHKPGARPKRFEDLLDQHQQWLAGQAEAAFPTIREVAKIYSDCLEDLNERELQGEGMQKVMPRGRGWQCPNEAWEILIRDVERKTVPAEVLQFCFAKRRTVTVKHAEVHSTFGGYDYHWRLPDPRTLMAFNGQQVEFAYDPGDLGTVALYYDNRFLGLADNVELRAMGERDFVQDERDRRRMRRELKKVISAAHTGPVPGVVERAARRAAVRPDRIEPTRVEVPAAIPAPIAEAVSAAREDREFSFASVDGSLPVLEAAPAATDSPDDHFTFFGGDHQ